MGVENDKAKAPCPHPDACEGEHEWEFVDDSFDHDLGTEVVYYMKCQHCDATRPMDASDDPEPDWFSDTEHFIG